MKIYAKMHPKSDPKIDVWALEGPTFEVLGGFLRSRIFDEFPIGKKSAKVYNLASEGWQQARREVSEGAVGA